MRKRSRHATVPLAESLVSTDDTPELVAEQNLDVERLLSATQQLTKAQREVISLRFPGGLSIAEAAKVIGKSQGAVKALQHSAILALRQVLLVE